MSQKSFWSGVAVGSGAVIGAMFASGLLGSGGDSRIIRLEKSVQIGADLETVFRAWAHFERTHGERDAAASLLTSWIERTSRELPATHYGLGALHLELAETYADEDKARAKTELDAAEKGFGDLPADHPLRVRAAALRNTLARD